MLENKGSNISETRKDMGKVTMHQRSFERYHPRPRTASPSLKFGVRNPSEKFESISSNSKAHCDISYE